MVGEECRRDEEREKSLDLGKWWSWNFTLYFFLGVISPLRSLTVWNIIHEIRAHFFFLVDFLLQRSRLVFSRRSLSLGVPCSFFSVFGSVTFYASLEKTVKPIHNSVPNSHFLHQQKIYHHFFSLTQTK